MTLFETPTQEFRASVMEEINRLPQADLLREDNVERWLESIYNIDRGRALWHARRASGIGGSEIGDLVAWRNGIYDTWRTPRDMALSKLLIEPPTGENEHTIRGGEMESYIQHLVQQRIPGAQRDIETLEKIRAGRHKTLSWMIGTPDDIWIIAGKRWVVDYKAPSRHVLEKYLKEGVSLEYRSQTKHYALICESYGIQVDVLANIFAPADTLATHAYKYFGATQRNPGLKLEDYRPPEIQGDLEIVAHPEDPEMGPSIIDAGNHYWNNYVMKGELPSVATKPKILFEGGIPQDLLKDARDLAALRVIGAQVYKKIDPLKESINEKMRKLGSIGEGNLAVSTLNVQEKVTYDFNAMFERLISMGVKEDDIQRPGEIDPLAALDKIRELCEKLNLDPAVEERQIRRAPQINEEKVSELFDEFGLDRHSYSKFEYETRVNAARSGPIGKAMEALKNSAGSMIEKSTAEILDPLVTAEVTIFEANERVLEKELKKAAAAAAQQEEIAAAGPGGLVEKLKKTRKKAEAPTAKPVVATPAAAEPARQVENVGAGADAEDTVSMLFGGRRP